MQDLVRVGLNLLSEEESFTQAEASVIRLAQSNSQILHFVLGWRSVQWLQTNKLDFGIVSGHTFVILYIRWHPEWPSKREELFQSLVKNFGYSDEAVSTALLICFLLDTQRNWGP